MTQRNPPSYTRHRGVLHVRVSDLLGLERGGVCEDEQQRLIDRNHGVAALALPASCTTRRHGDTGADESGGLR
jgi:hypothetical protein